MDTTIITNSNIATPPCAYCTISKWAKGDHEANIPQKWFDLISGKCIDENITLADYDVLMSMVMRLSIYLKEEKLRKLSFYVACNMFIYIVDAKRKRERLKASKNKTALLPTS